MAGTVGSGIAAVRDALRMGGVETWALEARLMMAEALGASTTDVFAYPERVLTVDEWAVVTDMMQRRLAREPLAYILGQREFWSLPFHVAPPTLIPRPETELLVASVLERFSDPGASFRVLDLGTGSGCILLSLLHERPRARGVGIDICEDALGVARVNAAALGLTSRAHFVRGDWAEAVTGGFEVIVTNPPYVPTSDLSALMPEVRSFEPRRALDGGPDGLAAYRRIVARLSDVAMPEAWVVMEIAPDLAQRVAALVGGAGFDIVAVPEDLAGRPRCVLARYRNGLKQ